ncbi:MAG: hypothetical protein P8175_19655 [Deltaproteobacteria bacterium]
MKPPRGKPRGILKGMAELSIAISPPSLKLRRALLAIHPRVAISPPSLKLRRALLAIHPRGKPRGILAKESKTGKKPSLHNRTAGRGFVTLPFFTPPGNRRHSL